MIRFMRSARVKQGSKLPEAIGFAKEIASFTQKYDGAANVTVCIDAFGDMGTIRWFADYPDLATMQKVMDQVLADAEYWKAVERAGDLFDTSTLVDLALREV